MRDKSAWARQAYRLVCSLNKKVPSSKRVPPPRPQGLGILETRANDTPLCVNLQVRCCSGLSLGSSSAKSTMSARHKRRAGRSFTNGVGLQTPRPSWRRRILRSVSLSFALPLTPSLSPSLCLPLCARSPSLFLSLSLSLSRARALSLDLSLSLFSCLSFSLCLSLALHFFLSPLVQLGALLLDVCISDPMEQQVDRWPWEDAPGVDGWTKADYAPLG